MNPIRAIRIPVERATTSLNRLDPRKGGLQHDFGGEIARPQARNDLMCGKLTNLSAHSSSVWGMSGTTMNRSSTSGTCSRMASALSDGSARSWRSPGRVSEEYGTP